MTSQKKKDMHLLMGTFKKGMDGLHVGSLKIT